MYVETICYWSSVNITDNKSENPLKPCASGDRVYLTYSQV